MISKTGEKSMKRTIAGFIVMAAFSFAGGFAAQMVAGVPASLAQESATGSGVLAPPTKGSDTPVFASTITQRPVNFHQVSDVKNGKGIQMYINDGQPGQIFYGNDGRIRLQLGTYGAEGERGLPLIGLSDNKGRLRLLLRLFGSNESPVLVMKDNTGRDRLVMGLAFSGPSQEPFIVVTDSKGASRDILLSGKAP
jgi:hypothetical protein